MAGYVPWMAGAVSAAKRANAAAAKRHRDERYEVYREYAAESRACGYEVESFEEWMGESRHVSNAEILMDRGYSLDDALYYGDR